MTPFREYNEILIDFTSNWANCKYFGLTEIKIFDSNYKEISIDYRNLLLFVNNIIKKNVDIKNILNN